ncbi:MAG: DUF5011 domain-containing protein [bacterium]|nr:DUF5011 domain-containing protein [bacterium]
MHEDICAGAANGGVLTTDANGVIVCEDDDNSGGAVTVNTGVANQLAYYSGATTIDHSDWLTFDVTNKRFGIGTTSPGAVLSVSGDVDGTEPLFLVSTSSASVASTTVFIIDSQGDVGIGTSTVQVSSEAQGTTLTIASDAGVGVPTAIELITPVNGADQASGKIGFFNRGVGSISEVAQIKSFSGGGVNYGYLTFSTAENGTLSEQMRIDDNGKVGIGTTSPASLFSVHGDAMIAGTSTVKSLFATSTIFVLGNDGTASSTIQGGLQITSGGLSLHADICAGAANGGVLTTDANGVVICEDDDNSGGAVTTNAGTQDRLAYYSAGTTIDSASLLSINNTESVFGFGTTTPSYNSVLTVGATSTVSDILTLKTQTGYGGNVLTIQDSASTTLYAIMADTASTTIAFGTNATTTIQSNNNAFSIATSSASGNSTPIFSVDGLVGSVGINIASTSATLDVQSFDKSTNVTARFSSGNGVGAQILLSATDAGGRNWGIISTANDAYTGGGTLQFYDETGDIDFSGDAARMVLTSNSFLGVGTTTPREALSINGNALISGTTTMNGLIATSSVFLATDGTANVGIGTLTPFNTLQVEVNEAYKGITVNRNSASDRSVEIIFADESVRNWSIGADANADNTNNFYIYDQRLGDYRFFISDVGNIGIGATTSPSQTLSVHGGALISGTTTVNSLFATSTALLATQGGNVGIGTTSPSAKLSIEPTADLDSFLIGTSTATSTWAFRVDADGRVAIGTSTNTALLNIGKIDGFASTTSAGPNTTAIANVAGIDEYFRFDQEGGKFFGNSLAIENTPSNSNSNTVIGDVIKIQDNTSLSNVVRGIEVQTDAGSNTSGENTGISSFARTFGVSALTTGNAGASFLPAGVLAQTEGTTQGNAFRAYSSTITTETLAYFFQESSAFSGAALRMNLGQGSGSFTGNFLQLQVAGATKFLVTNHGTTTIGQIGQTTNAAGLKIGYGAVCIDNDGGCGDDGTVDLAPGTIYSVAQSTGNSDVAEMYFSDEEIENGEIIVTIGGYTIGRATQDNKNAVIGVVSTKPGLLIGADDKQTGANKYPVALAGRVPVKVSTEGGDINIGDRVVLSSLDGIGMSAESGISAGPIIGIALEAFDGTKALSEAVIDQLADNETPKEKIEAEENKIDDGCYYSGGRIDGNTGCAPVQEELLDDDELEQSAKERSIQDKEARIQKLSEENTSAGDQTTLEGETVKVGKIMVFVNLGYARLDSNIQGGEVAGGAFTIEEGTGRIKAMGILDMNNFAIENVRAITGSNNWSIDESGKLTVKEIETDKLKVEKGVTTRDSATGEYYCIFVDNGTLKTEKGVCGEGVNGEMSSNETNPETPLDGTSSNESADVQAPTVTLNGSTDITIPTGVTYSDPGAQVTDNINQNLGYSIAVNGEEMSYVQIDTADENEYTIIYTAIDQAGNIGIATRHVSVVDETAPAVPPLSSEPRPLGGSDVEPPAEPEVITEETVPQDEPITENPPIAPITESPPSEETISNEEAGTTSG